MLTCCSEDATCVALAACIVASFAMRRLSSVLFLRASTSAERSTSRFIASVCLSSSRVSRSSTCRAKASGREGQIWRKLLRGGLASKGLPEPWHPWCRSGWPGPRSEPPPPSWWPSQTRPAPAWCCWPDPSPPRLGPCTAAAGKHTLWLLQSGRTYK